MKSNTITKVALSDVVTAINSASSSEQLLEKKSAEIKSIAVNTAKSVQHASALVWGYCSISGNSQAQIVNALGGRQFKSTVSRYFTVGAIQAKLGTEKILKAGVTPNDINTALAKGLKVSDLESVKSVSDLKRVLTPKHPSAKRKAKPNAKAKAVALTFQALEDSLADLALSGKVTFEQLEKLAKRVAASIKLAEQKKSN